VWGKSVSFSLVEDIHKVVVFFWDRGKVNQRRVGYRSGLGSDVF
jgi:hypothetical protein